MIGNRGVQKNSKPKIEPKNRFEKSVNRDENLNFFGSVNRKEFLIHGSTSVQRVQKLRLTKTLFLNFEI